MRCLVAGATGFVGRALCAQLVREGADVRVLTRDPAKTATQVPGARGFGWDALSGLPPAEAFEGVDAVVNLVGETVAARWNPARKQSMLQSRVRAASGLVERFGVLARPPKVFISMSGTGYYGSRGDDVLTESSQAGKGFLAEMAAAWEAAALGAERLGVRTAVLRAGAVLGREGGILQKILTPFGFGLGGRLGDGRQYFPWIHLADLLGLIRHVREDAQLSGPVNAVAPEPVTNAELTAALGERLHRPTFVAVPAFALRLALGTEMADELLLASQRVSPIKALESHFKFEYPLLREALVDAVR